MATAVPVDPSISKADLLLKALQMKAEQDQALSQVHVGPGGVAWAGPNDAQRDTQDQLSSAITDLQPDDPMKERYENIQRDQTAGLEYNLPENRQQRQDEDAFELAKARAPEEAKTAGALALGRQENQSQQDLIKMFMGGKGPGGAGSAVGPDGQPAGGPNYVAKPTLTANGKMSVTLQPNTAPALVQRSYSQLTDAKNKTEAALADAEAQYPGITAAAQGADAAPTSDSWLSYLTGSGAKYGGMLDQLGAKNERLKYTMGIPTPFAKLAQESSFGNIEQMAGQLPGVRGLATITPMFKEHQSRWGQETPLATVQRLLHMKAIMDDSLNTMRTTPAELLVAPEKGQGQ